MRRSIAFLSGAALLAVIACSHRLPPAAAHAKADPVLDGVPPTFSVCWLEYGQGDGPGFPITAGPTEVHKFHGTASGMLIRHPDGDVLIDAGNSPNIHAELKRYPFFKRRYLEFGAGRIKVVAKPQDAIKADGVDPAKLKWFIPSHEHLDHLGGVLDLPATVPVLMDQEAIDFIRLHKNDRVLHVIPEQAAAIEGRMNPIPFTKTPYENFDESYDLYGDGSVVLVKLPGHTPGSIGTFVNLSPTRRIFHVGDTVFAREAITKRQPKGLLIRALDVDRAETGVEISKLAQLAGMEPALKFIPAHERAAWQAAFGDKPGCLTAGP